MSQRNYTQLSYEERVLIEDWNKDTNPHKRSLRQFAKHLGRNPGTISRELSRNGRPPTANRTRVNKPCCTGHTARGRAEAEQYILATERYWKRRKLFLQQNHIHYTAKAANRQAFARVKRPGLKLEQPENEELLSFVITALDSRWSPEQISGRIRLENILPNISHKAIYRFIKIHKVKQDLDLVSCLRRKGKKYKTQKTSTYNTTDNRRSIDERPEAVNALSRVGDLEGDTIVGKDQKDRLLTHVERVSGLVSIGLVLGYKAEIISQQTRSDVKRVFIGKCYTVTYDNGPEFSCWHKTERELRTDIFFAHAYHSWERGRNENTNGLIRDFLPKGTDFKQLTQNDILIIESLLNSRPRKRLGWLTPSEYYTAHVALEG